MNYDILHVTRFSSIECCTVESLKFPFKFKSIKTSSPGIKMPMLERRALLFGNQTETIEVEERWHRSFNGMDQPEFKLFDAMFRFYFYSCKIHNQSIIFNNECLVCSMIGD